jgi:hypothetical protein
VATTLRAIVDIDYQLLYRGKVMLSFLPPQKEAIDHKVTGLIAVAEEKKRFAGHRLQYPARHKLFLGVHVMIQSLNSGLPA